MSGTKSYTDWLGELCTEVEEAALNNKQPVNEATLKLIENVICPGDRLIIEQDNLPVIIILGII